MNILKFLMILSLTVAGAAHAQTFTLKSNDLGGQMSKKQFGNHFGCSGENISPELHWENAPKEAVAFAITMYDLDAKTGSGFWHWVVYNISPNTTSLVSDAGNFSGQNLPKGAINGKNDAGAPGYVGPCPPDGTHRYVITVFALKAPVEIDKNASTAVLGNMLNLNALQKASLLIYAKK